MDEHFSGAWRTRWRSEGARATRGTLAVRMDDAADDAEIVRSIASRGRDARDAEAVLCRRFAPRAQLYGLKHLRDSEGARDLAQAVMLAVLEAARAGRVEDPMRIDRFVLGTCRNVALRMREVSARATPTESAGLDVRSFVPESEPMDVGALMRCLAELDGRGRRVVYLSFNEGKAADEIASALATTAGNVRVLRHRALAQLRHCMDECKAVQR
jgi:RNA polymerase sigma-70 factor (ECF subfamily)